MERIDFACSHPHYIDHAAPVWHSLSEDCRGEFFTTPDLAPRAESHGITAQLDWTASPDPDRPVVVLSARDESRLPYERTRLVFLEHGLGQTYGGVPHTVNNRRIVLFLTNPCNADALARHNPHARVVVVGPVKLDTLVERKRRRRRPVVAFSHHWQQPGHPEMISAWPWSKDAIERLAASGRYEVLGHKHPADRRDLEGWWASLGVEFAADFCDVLARADVYVCDNSSTIYEAAAHGIPVVCLSPPWYRRDVEHNPRFWSAVPGVHVLHPDELEAAIADALADTPERAKRRRECVESVYGPLDRGASKRAAAALEALCRETPGAPSQSGSVTEGRDRVMGVQIIDGRDRNNVGKMITTSKRLYDTDAQGVTTLAYPVGAQVPEAEYRRLTGAVAAEKAQPAPEAPAPAQPAAAAPSKPLSRMNHAELDEVLADEEIMGLAESGATKATKIGWIEQARRNKR